MKEVWQFYAETVSNRYGHLVYEISDQGNVKRNGVIIEFDKNLDPKKYYRIGSFIVHKMVAETYIPNPENKPCIDHINGDRHDNRACNLRWCTYQENNSFPLVVEKQKAIQKVVQKEAQNRQEVKAKNSASHKGSIMINLNNEIEKHVKESELEYWFSLGYKLGGKTRNTKKYAS